MYRILSLLVLSIITVKVGYAQAKDFVLRGNMKGCENCKISLRESLSNQNVQSSNTEIFSSEGNFVLKGKIFDPTEVMLIINDSLYTNPFFLESGDQEIVLDINALSKPVFTNSNSNREYQNIYLKQMAPFQKRIDNYYSYMSFLENEHNKQVPLVLIDSMGLILKTIINERELALLAYVKQHPASMVAIWHLHYRVYVNGYTKTHNEAYGLLDKKCATSYTGIKVKSLLQAGRLTKLGATFPHFTVLDLHKSPVSIFKKGQHTYTLIDFWFSGCLPCIRQFDELKGIFNDFKVKGFSIQGVSIDARKDELAWTQAITKHQLPWPQLWDVDGKVATRLAIRTLPTNLLVDIDGKIVARDIEPHDLKRFLETHFDSKKEDN